MAQYFYFDDAGVLFLKAKEQQSDLIERGYTEKLVPDGFNHVKTETEDEYAEKTLTETEESMTYADNRVLSYPSIGEQLDKLFHDLENGTLDQTGEFFTAIKAIKDSNPKSIDEITTQEA